MTITDATHLIDDVVFEKVKIGGNLVRLPEDMDLTTNEFVRNLRFVT